MSDNFFSDLIPGPTPKQLPSYYGPTGTETTRGMQSSEGKPFDPMLSSSLPGLTQSSYKRLTDATINTALGFVGEAGAVPEGLVAYHGTPHSFPAEARIDFMDGRPSQWVPLGRTLDPALVDAVQKGYATVAEYPHGRFRLDKIGTGEGAQAYGHGLYFAEHEGIAKGYRDTLTAKMYPGGLFLNGKPISLNAFTGYKQPAALILKQNNGDYKAAEDAIKAAAQKVEQRTPGTTEKILAALQSLKNSGITGSARGSMYKVLLNVKPTTLLDWDKPFAAQPPQVQQAFQKAALELSVLPRKRGLFGSQMPDLSGYTGGGLYRLLAQKGATSASERLSQKGISGVQYLDAISRAKGQGTKNYVMFSEAPISILRKYGIVGMIGGGAAAVGANRQNQ